MKNSIYLFSITLIIFTSCTGQTSSTTTKQSQTKVGGPCDGCEKMYEAMPATFSNVDTSEGWEHARQKLLVTGIVYEKDGKTPAPGVMLYYYHTDSAGEYSRHPEINGGNTMHGYLRGWLKTNENGEYAIYTSRPASYPGRNMPAHIHYLIKETGLNEYYVDDIVFDDDPLLTDSIRSENEERGGNAVLHLRKQGNVQVGTRNIILGLNVPGYPR